MAGDARSGAGVAGDTGDGEGRVGADAAEMLDPSLIIETGDGFDYTGADFRGWCTDVGFQGVEVLPFGGPTSAGIAYK